MITYGVECLEDQLEELKPMLELHYQELALDKDKVPLSPQYDIYIQRERLGELIMMAARKDGELIGYFFGFISPGLHYSTCLTCIMDIFYIHPDHRGSMCGVRLFKTVEKELKRRGVDRWFVGSKCHLDASWLFERLGFERVEVTYSKYIGE
jgi:N-acetylglutamate synthase-like GNAT family acetyltransferase